MNQELQDALVALVRSLTDLVQVAIEKAKKEP